MRVTSKTGRFERHLIAYIGLAFLLSFSAAQPVRAQQDDKSKSPDAKDEKKDEKKKEETLPLKPARKISFSTDEGTWMSLDVSPDGKQIVFDLLGDLYVIPISGGEATRLTSGLPVGLPAAIFARRQADRLHQRPQRQRQSLDHEFRWH